MVKFAQTISKPQTVLSLPGFVNLGPQSLSQQADLVGAEMRKQFLDEMQKREKLHKNELFLAHAEERKWPWHIVFMKMSR